MPSVLALMAHPDDIEFTCAGTLILLKRAGWDVHLATASPGDLGSMKHTPAQIARIRKREAARSAALIGATYTCLELRDLRIALTEDSRRRATAVVRMARPDVLITLHPQDYMVDHQEMSRISREAAFASTVPNWKARLNGRAPRVCDRLPVVYYTDPVDHVDHFGERTRPHRVVDITPVIDLKTEMLAAHESQRSWLREQHGEDEYLHWMKRFSAERAKDFRKKSVKYAEGFTQHLGHAFPKEDVLAKVLGPKRVKKLR